MARVPPMMRAFVLALVAIAGSASVARARPPILSETSASYLRLPQFAISATALERLQSEQVAVTLGAISRSQSGTLLAPTLRWEQASEGAANLTLAPVLAAPPRGDRAPVSFDAGSSDRPDPDALPVLGSDPEPVAANWHGSAAGVSARWQGAEDGEVRLRLGQEAPLALALSRRDRVEEVEASWSVGDALALRGGTASDGSTRFGGSVSAGDVRLDLTQKTNPAAIAAFDARLTVGDTQVSYWENSRERYRFGVRQDFGPTRWQFLETDRFVQVSASGRLWNERGTSGQVSLEQRFIHTGDTASALSFDFQQQNGVRARLGWSWGEVSGPTGSLALPVGEALTLEGSFRTKPFAAPEGASYRLELRQER